MNTHKQYLFTVRLLRVLIIFSLIFTNFSSFVTTAQAQGPPNFVVYFHDDPGSIHIDGWEWEPFTTVTIYQDGDETATVGTDGGGNFRIHIDGDYNSPTGMVFTLTDATNTKDHTVPPLSITGVDRGADTVTGTANPGTVVDVGIHGGPDAGLQVTASAAGTWVADFSGQWDITFGTDGAAQIMDSDNDGTWKGWRVPNTHFNARLDEDRIGTAEWPEGLSVTVSVDDPSNGPGVDYTDTDVVIVPDGDPNQTHLEFNLQGVFDLQAGHVVTLSGGSIVKVHTVTNLTITNVDTTSDTVSGTADAGTRVNVWACDDWGCIHRDEIADGQGYWEADFSIPGDEDWEQDLADIQPGSSGDANQGDDDGDNTRIGWNVPAPHLQIDKWPHGNPGEGGNFTFQINYSNHGNAPAENVIISDTMMSGLSYLSDTSGFSHTGTGTGPIIWDVGTLPPHSNGWFDVFVEVTGIENDPIENRVEISTTSVGDQGDPSEKESDWSGSVGPNDTYLDVWKGSWTGDPAAGTDFVSNINVCNNGSTDSSEVTLTDDLPAELTFVDWWGQHEGWEIVSSGDHQLVVSRPSMPGGWCSEVYLKAHLDDGIESGTSISNFASIQASNDVSPDDNESTWWGNVSDPHTNLYIDMWWNWGQLVPGGQLAYSVNYQNNGNAPVDGSIFITDTLPAGTSFNSAWYHDQNGNQHPFTPISITADRVVWEITHMELGNGYNFEVMLDIDESAVPGTDFTNTVEISPQPVEDSYDDNTTSVTETIFDHGPNLRVQKWHNWNGDGQLGYQINFENIGDQNADDVWITDTLPEYTTWDGWWDMNFDWGRFESQDHSNGELTWNLSEIYPGESQWIYFNANLDEPGTPVRWYENLVEISTVSGDTNPSDNSFMDTAFSGGEVNHVDLEVNGTNIWGCVPQGPVTITTASEVIHSGDNCFNENVQNNFEPGDEVTVSAGSGLYPVVIQIPEPFDVNADSQTEMVWGQIGGWINKPVEINADFGYQEVQTDSSGNYSATFGDIPLGGNGTVRIYTEVNYAQVGFDYYFGVPNPQLEARPEEEYVSGRDWPEAIDITLTIDDPATQQIPDFTDVQTAYAPEWDPNQIRVDFYFHGAFDLQTGHIVTLSDGSISKEHTVTSLAITGVDPGVDTVFGSADAGTIVDVWIHGQDAPGMQATPDSLGNWDADFTGQWDIVPGSDGAAQQNDDDGDYTWVHWQVPNPLFAVRPDRDNINGWDWARNLEVTVTLDNVYSTTESVDGGGNFYLNLDGVYDIVPGTQVEVTDGANTKDHVVTNLSIDTVDVNLDRVYGTATPDAQVNIWICGQDDCANRWEIADGGGSWWTDFAESGNEEGEEQTADIGLGTRIDSGEWDEDGDNTHVYYDVPNPRFQVRSDQDRIEGWQWAANATVAVTLDGVYSTTAFIDGGGNFGLSLDNEIEIIPGTYVEVTDGFVTKTHNVTPLAITEIDIEGNAVSGVTNPEATMNVWIDGHDGPNLWVTADESGNWRADFSGQYEFGPGTSGGVEQHDDDGDSTKVDWYIADSRMNVSYEHDWIGINDFTPNGEVTYTIFDYQGGHALFGPVTGPVDSHGEGWISWQLHHTDLIPGMFITAMNESTGEEVSVLIREVNLDYVSAEDDRAFGTAEPNTTIEFHISETHNDGFNIMVPVDGTGYWEIDLAAAGYPIDEYRHADARLYDAEGDHITAQNPRLKSHVSTDNFGVDNFSKNQDVTVTLYDSPGGSILYGPDTLRTESSGSAWVNLWDYGIDLQVGHVIVAYDHYLGFTKTLEIEPFAFDEMNVDDDYVRGTSAIGEWVDLHVESLFSNWGLDAHTDNNNNWFADYGLEDYDITEQMWGYGWAVDNQGNWSEDHITGLPNIEVSIKDDWISGWNFTPNRQVRIEIFDVEEGNLLAEVQTDAHGNTQFNIDSDEHEIDLQDGMHIVAEDVETGKVASLTLVYLTFDWVDYDLDTAWGQAFSGTQIVVRADWLFDNYEMSVVVDESDSWFVDFATLGADLTTDWSLRAIVFDAQLDATVADAPRPPEINASLDGDWVNGNYWTPNGDLEIWVYTYKGGAPIASPIYWNADSYGNFDIGLNDYGIDLVPGNYILVHDVESGQEKDITLVGLTIEYIDPDNDVAGGQAPPDTRIHVDFRNQQEGIQFDLFSEANGNWEADFGAHDFDLTPGSWGDVSVTDDDGDATLVYGWVPNPVIQVEPLEDRIEGWEWPEGSWVTLTIDDDQDPGNGVLFEETDMAMSDPRVQTRVTFDLDGRFDLQPGHLVVLDDGEFSKSIFVTNLAVTEVDPDADIIRGTASPNGEVEVMVTIPWNWQQRWVTADENGNWEADFSNTMDLFPGISGFATEPDEDGDWVWVNWSLSNPRFLVRLMDGEVHGNDWPLDEEVTIFIDDPNTPDSPDFTDIQTVEIAGWDPDETWVGFPYDDQLGVEPGFVVIMTDGMFTKTHTVTPLMVDNIDEVNDTVSGTASPYAEVYVDVWGNGGASRSVTADLNGSWFADFSIPGNEGWEQEIFDIAPGTDGEAQERDEDDDGTQVGWQIVFPPICDQGDSVSGVVYEGDGTSPIAEATVYFDDYDSDEQHFQVQTDENGFYSCALPDGDYRIWAVGWGFSREYFEETIYENATAVHVEEGLSISGVNFTLDTSSFVYEHFTFNIDDPVIGDIAVRQAVAFGTDRMRMIEETYPASPLLDSYLSPLHWAYADSGLMQYDYDPQFARDILDQAGWVDEDGDGIREKDGLQLHIVYVTGERDQRITISQIFAENMSDIGADVEVHAMPFGQWVNRIFNEHDFGIAQFAWGSDLNDDNTIGSMFETDDYNNAGSYSNPTADQMLALARMFGSRAEKLSYLKQHQIIVMADLATLPLLQRGDDEPDEPSHTPEVDAGINQTVDVGEVVHFSGSFTDPDEGDTYTIEWDFGDGSTASGTLVLTYTYSTPGTYFVTLTVSDDDGTGVDVVVISVQEPFLKYCVFGEEEIEIKEDTEIGCSVGSNDKVEIKKGATINGDVFSTHGNIKIEEHVTINGNITSGGDTDLDKYVFVQGDVISNGDVVIKRGTLIEGNVMAAGNITLREDAVVNGMIEEYTEIPALSSISLPELSITADGDDVEIGEDETLVLPPGSYGKLEVKEDANLVLQSGQYVFEKIEVKEKAAVQYNLSGGPIIIDVETDLEIKEDVQMIVTSSIGDAADILFRVQGKVELKKDGQYLGTYLATGQDIELKEDNFFEGALYGGKVEIKENAQIIAALASDVFLDLYGQDRGVSMFLPGHDEGMSYEDYENAVKELAEMIEDRTGLEINPVLTSGQPSDGQDVIIDALNNGHADIAMLNWAAYLVAHDTSGAEAFLGTVRFGNPFSRSQLLTYDGSGISTVSDFAGRHLCWADPNSISGYMIPSWMLMAEGIDPDADAEFANGHTDVVQKLLDHHCDGGAAYVDARDPFAGDMPDIYDVVLRVDVSPEVPNEGFIFGKDVPTELRSDLEAAIIEIASTPEGESVFVTIMGFAFEGLVEIDHSDYNGLETLITDAGLTPDQVWDVYFH